MKITVDTNILISATFWLGASHEIIVRCEAGAYSLILSEAILDEYVQVLHYREIQDKIKKNNLGMMQTVEKIRTIAAIVTPTFSISAVKEDPDDNMVLECAKEGDVDCIISNDKHLLSLGNFEKIPILTLDISWKRMAQ